jgi:hypothetical protein
MQEFHDTPWAGHMGLAKTLQNIKRVYWWKGMKRDVQEYIKHCDSCQRCKGGHDKVAGLLKPLPIPAKALESISVDFITDLPMTLDGYDSVMVVVDRLTKMMHFVPTRKDATALDCAKLFRREIFRIHGCPKSIVSDRDPKFVSGLWTGLLQTHRSNKGYVYSLSPTNGWSNREDESVSGGDPKTLCVSTPEGLGGLFGHGGVRNQQCGSREHRVFTLLPQLWVPPCKPCQPSRYTQSIKWAHRRGGA